MSCLFGGCSSLKEIPDISKWKTKNVYDIGGIFYECSSLKYVPDISKWNTNNVFIITSVFYQCLSLQICPDKSKWNTKNVIMMSLLFFGCSQLEKIPDISKWDKILTNDIDIITLLMNFSSVLEDLKFFSEVLYSFTKKIDNLNLDNFEIETPSEINTFDKIKDYIYTDHFYSLYGLFAGCSSLKSLPDISIGKLKT